MQPDVKDQALLLDMYDSAQAILDLIHDVNFNMFSQDRRTRRAVERELEIIGEAAKKVSVIFKEHTDHIPWRRIIGLRNILAHEYGEVQYEIIWKVVIDHIPELVNMLKPFVEGYE